MNIKNKDLNLLSIFVGIAEELNLTRASNRLGLSQPALSHALSRLRDQFGDPLFVRGQRGLVATPRVSVLLPQIRTLLTDAEKLYGPGESLDLTGLKRKVVIASTAYFESRMLAGFIRHVRAKAPGLELETYSLSGGFPKRELESGEFDLAVAAYFDEVPDNFKIKTIFSDRFVCVCSTANPYLKTKCATADYLKAKHMQIEVPRGVFVPVDQYLKTRKKHRDIALRIGNFLTPGAILHESELLLSCPLSLATAYKGMYALAITELPFPLAGIDTKMVWHEKSQHDPFHVWLRECIKRPERAAETDDHR